MDNFSKNLKKLRSESKLTQMKLAEDLGVKCYNISDWEQGRAMPTVANMTKIADYFAVSLDLLIRGEC